MLGEKLMKLRRISGMSQQDVATALSVSRQTISNWESGASAPDIAKAKELAALFHISLDDLASDEVDVIVADRGEDGVKPGDGEVDLHVLKSIEGAKCRIALASGSWMPGPSLGVDVLEIGADWVRVACDRPFRGHVVELVDLKSIVGFQIVSPADAEGRAQHKEAEQDGCERMD